MHYDVIVIGAGASGMMCAAQAGMRGRRVMVLDHHNQTGNKIGIAGGGKCNFTNMEVDAKKHYICANPYFPISALSRFSQWDFLDLIAKYEVPYEEREHGQLFCERTARDIINLLHSEMDKGEVQVKLRVKIGEIKKSGEQFLIEVNDTQFVCKSLVIATGGLSLPQVGASNFGLSFARELGLNVLPARPGLVPLITDDSQLRRLAGLSFLAKAYVGGKHFTENLLITHRGLSGPVILQASNYWRDGEPVVINALPDIDLGKELTDRKQSKQKTSLSKILGEWLPKRFIHYMLDVHELTDRPVNQMVEAEIDHTARAFHFWQYYPTGTERYRTAEVTLGGVDTDEISSKTMESKKISGLYFVGEVLDVAGHLGGYNLQWAWASGYCAGQFV